MENYKILESLSMHSASKVFKVLRKSDEKIFVSKEIYFGDMTEREKKQLISEVNVLSEIRHANIIRYINRILDKDSQTITLISEYCDGGDFQQLLKRLKKERSPLSEEQIWKYFMQLILAIHEIYRNKVLHRNIKLSSLLLDSKDNLKLSNFGFFRQDDPEVSYYIAPEQIEGNKYSDKSEMWACGCFLYELCTLVPPFMAGNNAALALKIKNAKFDRIPSRYSDELQRVIYWLLTKNVQERPSIDDLLNIPEISMNLREKRLRDSKAILQKKEEDLQKKTD